MRYIHQPVCFKDGVDMQVDFIGIPVVFYFQEPPRPYEAYQADLYKCPECGIKVLVGMHKPYIRHFQKGADIEFAAALAHPASVEVHES